MSNEVEQVFAGMVLERTLKSGSNGSVCLVHDETGKQYIYRWFQGTEEVYQSLRGIVSPYLPKIYDVKSQGDTVYVLEEYICGDSLAFLLEAGPLSPAWVQRISMQLCQALSRLHQEGIVHRDVKPENILLRGSDAVLIDFDASRIAKPKGDTDTKLLGTAGYAAPEQYGFSQTDQRADIYAMGIVINEMLTGQHPSKKLVGGKFQSVVERCIEVNVDRRFSSAEALRLALKTCHSRGFRAGVLIAAAVLLVGTLAAVSLGRKSQPLPQATETSEASQPTQTATESLAAAEEPWQEPVNLAMPAFSYDLDQDGEEETYLFGICQASLPDMVQYTNQDYFALEPGQVQYRQVFPCVWQQEQDGAWVSVPEFAPLLEDAAIQLWRLSEQTLGSPQISAQSGVWPGGLSITYSLEHQGTWLYQIQATLDGEQLTAQAVSTVDSMENYRKMMEQNNQ